MYNFYIYIKYDINIYIFIYIYFFLSDELSRHSHLQKVISMKTFLVILCFKKHELNRMTFTTIIIAFLICDFVDWHTCLLLVLVYLSS